MRREGGKARELTPAQAGKFFGAQMRESIEEKEKKGKNIQNYDAVFVRHDVA
ncbi:hypothetical protein FACS1894200_10270 [Spirochaetia bacterium]|nr:hypothetical protein FACS1894200_10270 [Spirochaetia bacterium]